MSCNLKWLVVPFQQNWAAYGLRLRTMFNVAPLHSVLLLLGLAVAPRRRQTLLPVIPAAAIPTSLGPLPVRTGLLRQSFAN